MEKQNVTDSVDSAGSADTCTCDGGCGPACACKRTKMASKASDDTDAMIKTAMHGFAAELPPMAVEYNKTVVDSEYKV